MTKADDDWISYLQTELIEELRVAMELRGARNYGDLSSISGVPHSTVQNAMSGARCSIKTYERIATGLGVRIDVVARTIPGWVHPYRPTLREDTPCEGSA